MSKLYAKILELDSFDFSTTSDEIYIPANDGQSLEYTAEMSIKDVEGTPLTTSITNCEAFLVNTSSNLKYRLLVKDFTRNYVRFLVTSESNEDTFIDALEIQIIIGEEKTVSRLPIKVKKIKQTVSTYQYTIGTVKIIDSNFMSIRSKMAFPSWSTVAKNNVSTSLKLTEPLHSVFNSSYFKTNEYLKQSFDLTYDPKIFTRILLGGIPLNIIRVLPFDDSEELKETEDILSSVKSLEVSRTEASTDTVSVILEPFSENRAEVNALNEVLPTQLYFRKLKLNEFKLVSCTIKGFDDNDSVISETLVVREGIYTQSQNRFKKIVSIDSADNAVEITNIVDLRNNHYVINNPYITPPIIDNNYQTFKPKLVLKSNEENTTNMLIINNPTISDGEEQYRYCFAEDNIGSVYLTDELDLLYTTTSGDEVTKLCYSKLAIDLSKKTMSNKTTNNNSYISVSDISTPIGDWVEVTVNVLKWFEDTGSKALTLQIRNKDQILYYDQEGNTLSSDKVYMYKDLISSDELTMSIEVSNDSPFIFTVFDETLTKNAVALTSIDLIKPYSIVEVHTGSYLTLQDNNLILTYDTEDSEEEFSEITEDDLYITLKWSEYSTLNYTLNFGEHYISNEGTNISEEVFEYLSRENNTGFPVVIRFSKKELYNITNSEELPFTISSSYDIDNGLISEKRVRASLTITDINDSSKILLDPRRTVMPAIDVEYSVSIVDNLFVATRNEEYDK